MITKFADDDAEFLFDDDGPKAIEFSNALQMWALCQDGDVTVNDAALAFNATPEIIRQAVEDHAWMYLADDNIEHDGE